MLMSSSYTKVYFSVFITLLPVWVRISVFGKGAQSTPVVKRSIYRGVAFWLFWLKIVIMISFTRKAIRIIADVSESVQR